VTIPIKNERISRVSYHLVLCHWFYLIVTINSVFFYQVSSVRRQRSDLSGLRVKLSLITTSLTSQR